jgi:hypothetical protein
MRSVIAVTDGYLDGEDTIATRSKREWKVESELSSPEEVFIRTKALVAAYLNAARWGFKELVRHFETKVDAGDDQSAWIGPYLDPDDDENPVLVREALATLSSAGEEGTEQSDAQLLSRTGRLNVNPLIVAGNFVEMARSMVRVASRHAGTLERQFEGVDPGAEAAEIQSVLQNLSCELNSFLVKGDAS